jgi:hypothetical protein
MAQYHCDTIFVKPHPHDTTLGVSAPLRETIKNGEHGSSDGRW